MRTWALELENGWAERENAWVKGVNPYPFIKAANIKCLPTRHKTRLFPRGRAGGLVGLPIHVLMRIPKYGDMISALTRRAKETALRNTLRLVMKNDSNKDLAVV